MSNVAFSISLDVLNTHFLTFLGEVYCIGGNERLRGYCQAMAEIIWGTNEWINSFGVCSILRKPFGIVLVDCDVIHYSLSYQRKNRYVI